MIVSAGCSTSAMMLRGKHPIDEHRTTIPRWSVWNARNWLTRRCGDFGLGESVECVDGSAELATRLALSRPDRQV